MRLLLYSSQTAHSSLTWETKILLVIQYITYNINQQYIKKKNTFSIMYRRLIIYSLGYTFCSLQASSQLILGSITLSLLISFLGRDDMFRCRWRFRKFKRDWSVLLQEFVQFHYCTVNIHCDLFSIQATVITSKRLASYEKNVWYSEQSLLTGSKLLFPPGKNRIVGNPSAWT